MSRMSEGFEQFILSDFTMWISTALENFDYYEITTTNNSNNIRI